MTKVTEKTNAAGKVSYYVDGKRISRCEAIRIRVANEVEDATMALDSLADEYIANNKMTATEPKVSVTIYAESVRIEDISKNVSIEKKFDSGKDAVLFAKYMFSSEKTTRGFCYYKDAFVDLRKSKSGAIFRIENEIDDQVHRTFNYKTGVADYVGKITHYEIQNQVLEEKFNWYLSRNRYDKLDSVAYDIERNLREIEGCKKNISEYEKEFKTGMEELEKLEETTAEIQSWIDEVQAAENAEKELINCLEDYVVDVDAVDVAAEVEVENAKMANLAVSDKLRMKIAEQKNKPRKSIIDWTTIDEDNEVTTLKKCKVAA